MSFSPLEWQIVRFTLAVCAFSTLLILPVGLATAWLLDRYHWPGKLLVETVVTLPLVLPPVATGLVLLKMFGRRGPIGHFLSHHFDIDVVFHLARGRPGRRGDVFSAACSFCSRWISRRRSAS